MTEDVGWQRWVYFIQAGLDGPIKIGVAEDPDARLAQLQGAHYADLRLLGICAGGFVRERELHAALATERIRGEWFHPSETVLTAIGLSMVNGDGEGWESWRMQRLLEQSMAYPPSRRRSALGRVSTGESEPDATVWPDDPMWDG